VAINSIRAGLDRLSRFFVSRHLGAEEIRTLCGAVGYTGAIPASQSGLTAFCWGAIVVTPIAIGAQKFHWNDSNTRATLDGSKDRL
jgi:hypothetical protein